MRVVGLRDTGFDFDLTGLPIFYANKLYSKELPDGTVMVVCGIAVGSAFTPLYATITPIATALADGRVYVETALSGMKLIQ